MANSKSAEKRNRQALKRRDRNRSLRTRMRTAIKSLRKAAAEDEADTAQALLPRVQRVIDMTAQKGAIHRNTAARTKSRLAAVVNALGS